MKDLPIDGMNSETVSLLIKDLWQQRFPDTDPTAIPVFSLGHSLSVLLDRFHSRTFKALGHSHSTFAILMMLSIVPEDYLLTPAQLGQYIGQTSGGMNKTLKKLDEMGLIERRPNPADKRSVSITLTKKGEEEASRVGPIAAKNQLRRLESLSSDQLQQIETGMRLLIGALAD